MNKEKMINKLIKAIKISLFFDTTIFLVVLTNSIASNTAFPFNNFIIVCIIVLATSAIYSLCE